MLLAIEKLIILRSVEIFSKIPEKELIWFASQIKELDYDKGIEVIKEGDIGTSMFVVVHGEVEARINGEHIATFKKYDFFGELAALDPEPRSATIVTTKNTLLFEIEKEIIYDLISEYKNIAQGIITVLCQRLRNNNKS